MRKFLLIAIAALGLGLGVPAVASAAPAMQGEGLKVAAGGVSETTQVRVVCDRFGRCFRTGPRRVFVPRIYGPRVGFYGPRYRHRGYHGRRHWRGGRRW